MTIDDAGVLRFVVTGSNGKDITTTYEHLQSLPTRTLAGCPVLPQTATRCLTDEEVKTLFFPLHLLSLQQEIGTQQLDFLGNCQCRVSFLDNMRKEARAQVHIFDTTQIKGILLLFFVK